MEDQGNEWENSKSLVKSFTTLGGSEKSKNMIDLFILKYQTLDDISLLRVACTYPGHHSNFSLSLAFYI